MKAFFRALEVDDESFRGAPSTTSRSPPSHLPPALPGSPTLPPSGAVTPAATTSPSPTLPSSLPSPTLPPSPSLPPSPTLGAPFELRPQATLGPLSLSLAPPGQFLFDNDDFLATPRRRTYSSPSTPTCDDNNQEVRILGQDFENTLVAPLNATALGPLSPLGFRDSSEGRSQMPATRGPNRRVEVAAITTAMDDEAKALHPRPQRPHNLHRLSQPGGYCPPHAGALAPRLSLESENGTLGDSFASSKPLWRRGERSSGASGTSGVSGSGTSDSSKRNAVFHDNATWLVDVPSESPVDFSKSSVDRTSPSDRDSSDTTSAFHRLSMSSSFEVHMHDWNRTNACSSPEPHSSPASSQHTRSSDHKGLSCRAPPQAPPPRRPLPLLPDPSICATVPASLVTTPGPADVEGIPSRRPSLQHSTTATSVNLVASPHRRESSTRTVTEYDGGYPGTKAVAGRSPVGSRARSGSNRGDMHPYAAHPFAVAAPSPPLRQRGGSISSLVSRHGVPMQVSPSAPSFGSGSASASHRHGTGAAGGNSPCSPTSYVGNTAEATYNQTTWLFPPKSPETAVPQHAAHGGAQRRFASVTFRQDPDKPKKDRKDKRSSGYFDSKSDYGFGEGRTKTFMRKMAAWMR